MSAKQEQTLLIALNARGGKLLDTYLDALGVCHQAHALTLNSTSSSSFHYCDASNALNCALSTALG